MNKIIKTSFFESLPSIFQDMYRQKYRPFGELVDIQYEIKVENSRHKNFKIRQTIYPDTRIYLFDLTWNDSIYLINDSYQVINTHFLFKEKTIILEGELIRDTRKVYPVTYSVHTGVLSHLNGRVFKSQKIKNPNYPHVKPFRNGYLLINRFLSSDLDNLELTWVSGTLIKSCAQCKCYNDYLMSGVCCKWISATADVFFR